MVHRTRNTLRLLRALATPAAARPAALYDVLGPQHSLCRNALYLNLGYWDDGEHDYDRACERLAEELGTFAGLGPGLDLLDVGFGFGDQDLYFAERFQPRRIVGLNISRAQVELGRRRVEERGLADHIDLRPGSATAMPVASASFDVITSLESAFHYVTREAFFREAFRVLRPGGILATADILPRELAPAGLRQIFWDRVTRGFWGIPRSNHYAISTYEEKLRATGFHGFEARSIREWVVPPFARFARRRLREAEVRARMHPCVSLILRAVLRDEASFEGLDYWLVRACKPAERFRDSEQVREFRVTAGPSG